MNAHVVPEWKEHPIHHHHYQQEHAPLPPQAVLVFAVAGASLLVFLFGGVWHLLGFDAAFILLLTMVGIATALFLARHTHRESLHHLDKRHEQKDSSHRRETVTQALYMGCSVQVKYRDGSEMNIIHPTAALAGNASSTTIKELNMAREQQQELLPAPLPGPIDLRQVLEKWQPDGRNILLGIAPGEQLITVPIKELCHVALAGATGGGKSTLMRLLIPQLEDSGCQVMLADPHFTMLDVENGDDWRPIVSRLALEPAVSSASIRDLFQMLAYDELDKRLELRRNQQSVGKPIFLCMDELPLIVANVDGATDALVRLLREGRKVKILLVSAATDWLVKTLKLEGSSGVRDCFRTAFYVGGDTTSARVLLDVTGRVDDGGLGKGIVMLRSIATPQATLIRVPSVSNQALYDLLPTSHDTSHVFPKSFQSLSISSTVESAEKVTLPALDARSHRIRELLLTRTKTPPQIIKEIWKVEGGAPYQKAMKELAEIIATLIERGEV